jgi:hypothetical protein
MSLLSDIDDQLNMLRPMADKASGLEAIQLNEQIIKLLDEKDTLLGAGAKYKDGGQVLDRRMFMRPVMAAEGTYMPTIEQILNFYTGEFTDDGRPVDMEAFQAAIEVARKADEAGLFPEEGKPIDNYLYFGKDVKDFAEKEGVDVQEPVYGQYPSGAQLGELDKESSFLTDLYSIPARKEYADSRVESDKVKAEADAQKKSFLDAMEATKDFEFPKPEQVDVEQGFVEEKKIEDNPYLKELEKFQRTSGANVDMPMVDQRKLYQSGKAGIPAVELNENQVAAINARNFLREQSDQFGNMKPEDVERILIKSVKDNEGFKDDVILPSQEGILNNFIVQGTVPGAGVTSTPGYENFSTDMLNEYYKNNPDKRPIFPEGVERIGDYTFNYPSSRRVDNPAVERGISEDQFEITPSGDIIKKTGIEEVSNDVVATTPGGDIRRGDLEFEIKDSEKITDDNGQVKEQIKEQVEEQEELGFFERPENIKKYDRNGDGELSFLEKADAVAGSITGNEVNVPVEKATQSIRDTLEEGAKKEDVQIGMSQEDLAEDEKKLKDADLKDGADTKDDDEKKLSTAAESSTSSTSTVDEGNEMSAFDSEIAKVAKEAGFSWSDMTGDGSSKDNDALEMIMYGLKLYLTPGDFDQAVVKNAADYLNNKIKKNYKTAAAQSELKKTIFLKYLQGNIDLKKYQAEQAIKDKNKNFDESKYYSDDERDGLIANWAKTNYKLDLQGAEPGTPEYGILLAMRDEITNISSEYKSMKKPPPSNVTDLAWGRVNEKFQIIPGDDGIFAGIPLLQNLFKTETKVVAKTPLISVEKFQEIKSAYPNIQDEELIAILKNGVEINNRIVKFNTSLVE